MEARAIAVAKDGHLIIRHEPNLKDTTDVATKFPGRRRKAVVDGVGTATDVGDENGDGLVNEADRRLLPPTDLVTRAHAHGLLIHTWTFRSERRRLAFDYAGNPLDEYLQILT